MKNLFLKLTLAVVLLSGVASYGASPGTGPLKTVSILGDLRLVTPDPRNPYVAVIGLTAAGDGGGGIYRWIADSALSTNYSVLDTRITNSTGVAIYPGQWLRVSLNEKSPQTQTLAAATTTIPEAKRVKVAGTGGATTITATPAVAVTTATDGQMLILEGTSDTNTVVYSDDGTVAGSKLQLAASTRTLGKGDILVILYDATDEVWYEVSFANN